MSELHELRTNVFLKEGHFVSSHEQITRRMVRSKLNLKTLLSSFFYEQKHVRISEYQLASAQVTLE